MFKFLLLCDLDQSINLRATKSTVNQTNGLVFGWKDGKKVTAKPTFVSQLNGRRIKSMLQSRYVSKYNLNLDI